MLWKLQVKIAGVGVGARSTRSRGRSTSGVSRRGSEVSPTNRTSDAAMPAQVRTEGASAALTPRACDLPTLISRAEERNC
jgi:hypothetical protein